MKIVFGIAIALSAVHALFIAFYHFGQIGKTEPGESKGTLVLDFIAGIGDALEEFGNWLIAGFWVIIWGLAMLELVMHVNQLELTWVLSALVTLVCTRFALLEIEEGFGFRSRIEQAILLGYVYNAAVFGAFAVKHILA